MSETDLAFRLDDQIFTARVRPAETLADVLSLPEGCGEGICGSCTVSVDGVPTRACLMLALQAEGCEVRTVASLAVIENAEVGPDGLTPLQQALGRHRAFQCGWCVPGLLVGTASFLAGRTSIDRAEILAHLVGHLCRCTAGRGVVAAIEDVLSSRAEATR